MFSTHPTPTHTLRTQFYTPAQSSPLSSSPLRQSPSPLSPRHYNIPSAAIDYMLSPTPTPTKCYPVHKTPILSSGGSSGGLTKRESAFSKRPCKPNPLMHRNGEEGRETRRKLFLKQVKEGSEEKRWQKRGGDDEMMRTIFMLEKRREMERRRREAAKEEVFEMEEMQMEMQDDGGVDFEAVMREEEELEVLMRERERETDMMGEGEMPYGSDEEDYDELFMGVIREEMRNSSQQQVQSQPECVMNTDSDMMDVS